MTRLQRDSVAVAILLLLWLALPLPGFAAELKGLSVIYSPPHLSVEAQGVSLQRVLREIGEKVGFDVVGYGVSEKLVTVSILGESLKGVLGQLLREENYAVVYKEEEGVRGIEKLLLLSSGGYDEHGETRMDDSPHGGMGHVGLTHLDAPSTSQRTTYSSYFAEPVRSKGWPDDKGQEKVRPEDLLRMHALSGFQELRGGVSSAGLSSNVPPPSQRTARNVGERPTQGLSIPTSTPGADEELTATTRLAQQNLNALTEGLATATNSLLSSLANSRK